MATRDKKKNPKKNGENNLQTRREMRTDDVVPSTAAADQVEECGKSDLKLRPGDKTVKCSTCRTRYHKGCQNVSDAMYEFLSDEAESAGVFWFCYICRKTTHGMFQKLSNLEVRLQAIESKKTKDHAKVEDMSNKVQSLERTCQKLENKIQELVENNEKTLQTVSNLRRDLFNEHDNNILLQCRIDQLEQTQRECNVRVMGFPEHGVSDDDIKCQLMQLVGAQGCERDIATITRMGRPSEDNSRDLIVKFVSKKSRDEFYALRKKTPKNHENKKVYINEDLIETKAKLFYDARQLVKRGRLHGTWSQNGNIMVKVKANDNPCVIGNHIELHSKVRNYASDSDGGLNDEISTVSESFEYESELSD